MPSKPRKPGRRHKATPARIAKILAAAEKPQPGALRDRVVELRRVVAGDLVPNPKNWRRHPKAQRDALSGLDEGLRQFEQTTHGHIVGYGIDAVAEDLARCYADPRAYTISNLSQSIRRLLLDAEPPKEKTA